jgi:hypothetical protein
MQAMPHFTIGQVKRLLKSKGGLGGGGPDAPNFDILRRWYSHGPTTFLAAPFFYEDGVPMPLSTYGSSLVKSIINKELTLLFGRFPQVQLDIINNEDLKTLATDYLSYHSAHLFLKIEQAIKDNLIYGIGGVWLTPENRHGKKILVPEVIIPTEVVYDLSATTIAEIQWCARKGKLESPMGGVHEDFWEVHIKGDPMKYFLPVADVYTKELVAYSGLEGHLPMVAMITSKEGVKPSSDLLSVNVDLSGYEWMKYRAYRASSNIQASGFILMQYAEQAKALLFNAQFTPISSPHQSQDITTPITPNDIIQFLNNTPLVEVINALEARAESYKVNIFKILGIESVMEGFEINPNESAAAAMQRNAQQNTQWRARENKVSVFVEQIIKQCLGYLIGYENAMGIKVIADSNNILQKKADQEEQELLINKTQGILGMAQQQAMAGDINGLLANQALMALVLENNPSPPAIKQAISQAMVGYMEQAQTTINTPPVPPAPSPLEQKQIEMLQSQIDLNIQTATETSARAEKRSAETQVALATAPLEVANKQAIIDGKEAETQKTIIEAGVQQAKLEQTIVETEQAQTKAQTAEQEQVQATIKTATEVKDALPKRNFFDRIFRSKK